MAFTLYRLELGDPATWHEQLGDETTNTGGAPVPAIRSALRHAVGLYTFGPEADGETTATRLRLRRQLRSLLNNTPFKTTGLFLHWPTDPEQDGWYMMDKGQLEDGEGSAGIATGYFKVAQFAWFKIGAPRTHRKAMWVYLKDLRTGLFPRDYRRLINSTDFSTLETLALTYLPPGITSVASAASGATAALHPGPTGFDGGSCQLAVGLIDNLRVSFDQPLSSRNLGQVIAYDRRGTFTAPTKEVGAGWEEIYGPDYPYNWTEGGSIDTPVLTNGLCRVWFNREGEWPGWSVDVWNGTEWAQQGKITINRKGLADTTLLASQIIEYSETRVVMMCIMSIPSESTSRETVYVTLQRGWTGPTVEVYPALGLEGQAECEIVFSPYNLDTNIGAARVNAGGVGTVISTAEGTGHTGFWEPAILGATTFTGENQIMILRQGREYACSLAVVTASHEAFLLGNVSGAYGSGRNTINIASLTGWCRVSLSFHKAMAQQVLEAEDMNVVGSGKIVADAEASNGHCVESTGHTESAPCTQKEWPNRSPGAGGPKYRIFASVKASGGGAVKIKAHTSAGYSTRGTRETSSTTYVWLDLGDIIANGSALEILAWNTTGNTKVDRIEAFLVEDRFTEGGGVYAGGRDFGQSILSDSRTIPTVVTRSV